jgi:hypothetical protein
MEQFFIFKRKLSLLLAILLFGCMGYNNDILFLNNKIKQNSQGRYSLGDDLFSDRYYVYSDFFLELPRLPYGFFLLYRKGYSLPTLDTVRSFEKGTDYLDIPIKRLFIFEDNITVNSVDDKIYTIECLTPLISREVAYIPENFESGYEFKEELKFEGIHNLATNVYGLLDHEYLKQYNVDYGTPVIRAIISLGQYKTNNEYYLFGEAIYGFFSISTTKGVIIYYKDQLDFLDFLYTIGAENSKIIKFSYTSSICKKIKDKKRILPFETIDPY